MKKGLVEIVFILDRSGSMGGLEKDTIGGFNGMIEKQKKEEGEALISTILFDDMRDVVHDRVPLSKIPKMTDKDYFVRGCTALLDAIGSSIHHISNVHKYIREEDVPEKTIFIITTDGMENASREYSYQKIKRMVKEKKKLGWEFIFIGANIDAIGEASKFGIDSSRAVNYNADSDGTKVHFRTVGSALSKMRACESQPMMAQMLDKEDLFADIREDHNKRRNHK